MNTKLYTTGLLTLAIGLLLGGCGGPDAACFERDSRAVCFEGTPGEDLACAEVAPGEHMCTATSRQAVMAPRPCLLGPYSPTGCVTGGGGVGGLSACSTCSSCGADRFLTAGACITACETCLDYLSMPDPDPTNPPPGGVQLP